MSTIHRSAVTCIAILCLVTLVHFIPSAHAADALRVVSNEAGGSLKAASGDAGDGQGDPEQVAVPRMFIEPMAGLTSARHLAPARTAICRGTEVTLCQEVPVGATVTWGGISESARIGDDSFATKQLATVGEQVIVAVVETKDGDVFENRVVFDVVDITLAEIQIGPPTVVASELTMSDSMSNEETYKLFLARESIAQFRNVSLERQSFEATSSGRFGRRVKLRPSNPLERYRTSTSRTIRYGVSTDPPGFSPLMEWRVGDVAWGLGATIPIRVDEPGVHLISVGPPARPRQIELETYSVAITSHVSNQDIVQEGEVVVFEAVTNPPGYEDEITWLSSTKYGTASPVLGSGPTFAVQFDDTWGIDDGGSPFQWLGVRADNGTFNQDPRCVPLTGSDPLTTSFAGTFAVSALPSVGPNAESADNVSGSITSVVLADGTFIDTGSDIIPLDPGDFRIIQAEGDFTELFAMMVAGTTYHNSTEQPITHYKGRCPKKKVGSWTRRRGTWINWGPCKTSVRLHAELPALPGQRSMMLEYAVIEPVISMPVLGKGETVDDFLEDLASQEPTGDELFIFDVEAETETPFVTQFSDALIEQGHAMFTAIQIDELGNFNGLSAALPGCKQFCAGDNSSCSVVCRPEQMADCFCAQPSISGGATCQCNN